MKTTKRQFEQFKREFLHWQKKLGLTEWRVTFKWGGVSDGGHADITADLEGMVALVRYIRTVPEGTEGDVDPPRSWKHQAMHLLTARLYLNGGARCISAAELSEAWEALVRRLEKVL